MSGPSSIDFGDLAHTIGMLHRLAEWFDAFGNYTRAHDCRRLADGLSLYANDITMCSSGPVARAETPEPNSASDDVGDGARAQAKRGRKNGKPSSRRPWPNGYGQ